MKFSQPLSEVKTETKTSKPVPGAYKAHVVKLEEKQASSGNNMLVLYMDITDGPSAGFFSQSNLRIYREFSTEVGMRITKRYLQAFVASNEGMLTENDITGDEFDSSRLQGLIVGMVINNGRKGYLEATDLIPVADIDTYKVTAKPVQEPVQKATPENAPAEDDLPF